MKKYLLISIIVFGGIFALNFAHAESTFDYVQPLNTTSTPIFSGLHGGEIFQGITGTLNTLTLPIVSVSSTGIMEIQIREATSAVGFPASLDTSSWNVIGIATATISSAGDYTFDFGGIQIDLMKSYQILLLEEGGTLNVQIGATPHYLQNGYYYLNDGINGQPHYRTNLDMTVDLKFNAVPSNQNTNTNLIFAFPVDHTVLGYDFDNWRFNLVQDVATSGMVMVNYSQDPTLATGYQDNAPLTPYPTGTTSISFHKKLGLSSGVWYAKGFVFAEDNISLANTPLISFTVATSGPLNGGVIPTPPPFTINSCGAVGGLLDLDVGAIMCNIGNFFKGLGNDLYAFGQSTITSIKNLLIGSFPINIFYHINDDIAQVRNQTALASSSLDLIAPGTNISFFDSQTVDAVGSWSGIDWRGIFDYIIWIITGLYMVVISYFVFHYFKKKNAEGSIGSGHTFLAKILQLAVLLLILTIISLLVPFPITEKIDGAIVWALSVVWHAQGFVNVGTVLDALTITADFSISVILLLMVFIFVL